MLHTLFPALQNGLSTISTTASKHLPTDLYRHLRLTCGVMLAALSASAVAGTHFCIAGDLDSMAPAAVAACQAKMNGVRQVIQRRGAPDGWHFVVVCDEAGWKDYAHLISGTKGKLTKAGFHTDLQLRWTFLRGDLLDATDTETLAPVMDLVLRGIPNDRTDAVARARATQMAKLPTPSADQHLAEHSTRLSMARTPEVGSHS